MRYATISIKCFRYFWIVEIGIDLPIENPWEDIRIEEHLAQAIFEDNRKGKYVSHEVTKKVNGLDAFYIWTTRIDAQSTRHYCDGYARIMSMYVSAQ